MSAYVGHIEYCIWFGYDQNAIQQKLGLVAVVK